MKEHCYFLLFWWIDYDLLAGLRSTSERWWIYEHEPPKQYWVSGLSGWRVDHLNVPGGVSISKDTLQVWVFLKEESSNQRFEDLIDFIWRNV